MDKRTEEKLSQLAFGELSDREAAEVRELAAKQPESAAVLGAYEAMRNELRRLRDVPPDQLSKERLQNAILAGGLKPKPMRNGFSWLWVPTTALTLVLGMFLALRIPPGIEVPAGQSTESHGFKVSLLNDDDLDVGRSLRELTYSGNGSGDGVDRVPSTSVPLGDEGQAGTAAPLTGAPRKVTSPTPRRRSNGPARVGQPVERRAPKSIGEAAPNLGTLVIIQPGMDLSTGAQNAVEVSHTEDVVVTS